MNKLLHKHILQLNEGETCVDHINGDKLDNRRASLRGTTYGTNARNKIPRSNTGYLSVSEVKGDSGVFSAKSVALNGHLECKEVDSGEQLRHKPQDDFLGSDHEAMAKQELRRLWNL